MTGHAEKVQAIVLLLQELALKAPRNESWKLAITLYPIGEAEMNGEIAIYFLRNEDIYDAVEFPFIDYSGHELMLDEMLAYTRREAPWKA